MKTWVWVNNVSTKGAIGVTLPKVLEQSSQLWKSALDPNLRLADVKPKNALKFPNILMPSKQFSSFLIIVRNMSGWRVSIQTLVSVSLTILI